MQKVEQPTYFNPQFLQFLQSTLNENVSAVLLNEHEDSEEDGEAASNDRPAMSADMDADLSALLVSAGKDDNTKAMPGEDLLKEREDPSFADSYRPLRPFAKVWRLFLIICCQKRWGTRSSRPNWTNILVQRMSRVCEPRKWIPKSGASFRLPWKLRM